MVKTGTAAVVALVFLTAGCETGKTAASRSHRDRSAGYVWQLPEGFPPPRVPADNPMTAEKVELGRRLFHDSRLSGDGSVSCATCHQPALAYTDGRSRAVGMRGELHPRSAMSLANVAYNATLGWDDPFLTRLEEQALVPLLNTQPLEMGIAGRQPEVLGRLAGDRVYRRLFFEAFPEDGDPVTLRNVTYALAAFERTLISGNSAYDRWAFGGQADALDPDQRAGARLFFSRKLSCFRCHAGFNFSGPVIYEGSEVPASQFHNTGLYDLDGRGAYPRPNTGMHRVTGRREDMGKFRAPTLRNIALTAPYMHDGSIATLAEVIDHYAAGGRASSSLAGAPDTDPDFAKDALVRGFAITQQERLQLTAFLHALTDESFLRAARESEK